MAKNIHKSEPASGFSLGDVVYVLAKHKWKIILPTLLGLGGAVAYYFKADPVYYSKAAVMVQYIMNRSVVDNVETTSTPGRARGVDTVMISQIAIMQSRDLARSVVDLLQGKRDPSSSPDENALIEPDPALLARISPGSAKETLESDAIEVIAKGLVASVSKGSNILDVTFKHSDPQVATRVLDVVVKQYLAKHLSLYRSKAAAAEILLEVSKSEGTLKRAEGDLLKLRAEKEILTLDTAIENLNTEIAVARGQLNDADTRLAEQQARYEALLGGRGPVAEPVSPTAAPPEPGAASAPGEASTASPLNRLANDGTLTRYRAVLLRLGALRTENISILGKFTPESEAVKSNQAQIATLEREQTALEQRHPELVSILRGAAGALGAPGAPGLAGGPVVDLLAEQAALRAAEVRKQKLEEILASLQGRRTQLIQDAPTIAQAERNQIINEENHKYLMISKKKAELDQKLNSENIPNMGIVQAATPGVIDDMQRRQIALGIAGGAPAASTALVLLFGLLLNRTIKRPAEFEEKLGFPLMVAIPYFPGLSKGGQTPRLKEGQEDPKQLAAPDPSTPPWDPEHCIRPHAEAIRDRLGLFFEVNAIDHKPKLIAVTGQTAGAGASTVASGIAAALSETGDGKVLLVDMGGTHGAAHPFFDGRPAPSLSTAIRSSRDSDEAAENLFLAKADNPNPGITSIGASRLARLMPDLKASYFDYIIFDMPPLGNTSPTPTMAAFMDQVLVVVESETSTREEILRHHRDLIASHAKVSTVLNKVRPYGPRTVVGSL
jgi:succinoglycan biosynthesis transport protein ExoP